MDQNTTRLKEKLDRLEQDQKVNRLSLRAALALAARAGVDFAQDEALEHGGTVLQPHLPERAAVVLPPPSDATPLGPMPAAGALPRETRGTVPPPGQTSKARQWWAIAFGGIGQVVKRRGQTKDQAEERALVAYEKRYGVVADRVSCTLGDV